MGDNPIENRADVTMNKSRKRRFFHGCLGCLGVLIILIFTLIFVGKEALYRSTIADAHADPTSSPGAIMWALESKNNRLAKAVVSSSLWPEIEHWIDTHERVKCPLLPQLREFEGTGGGVGHFDSENGETFFVGWRETRRICPDNEHFYCLEVDEIRVEQENGKWIVTEIGDIKEYWSDSFCG